jgi:thiamine biosynthesis lipoprotein
MLRALFLACLLALPASAEVYLTREEALKLAFPNATARAERQTNFPEAERAASGLPAELHWWRFERDGELLGYACIDDVLGKEQPITFLLATDPTLKIRSIEILAYRESHGGEVRRADWRAQFAGKDPDSPLRVGRDVKNIAGATISCRNLTNGVRVRLEALRRAVARAASRAATVPAVGGVAGATRRCQLLMGTTLAITLDAVGDARSDACFQACFDEVRRLEGLYSDWEPASELSLLNRSGSCAVGPELEQLLGLSLEVSAQSQGGFDASVGPLVLLWREARRTGVLPEAEACRHAAAAIGWRSIELDREQHRARLARAGMALDLGGIGKGYALDRAAAIVRARGFPRALLDFGGQLLALDAPAGRSGWPVEARDPRGDSKPLFELELHNGSLSTTSDDQLGIEVGGTRYSHVIDPRRGAPVAGRLAACVLASEGARADAWSTALYVLGAESGLPLAQRAGLAALVLEGDGSAHETASWQPKLRERP